MGYTPYYQAIPEGSRLFSRLRADQRLAALMDQFFTSGSRPLDLDEAGPAEVTETLEWVVETESALFHSLADAERALAALREEIRRAEEEHPGLVGRRAFLDKSQDEIAARLVKHLSAQGRRDAAEFVDSMLCGVEGFAEGLQASLVPSGLVAEAAEALQGAEPESLFSAEEDSALEDYREWRQLYVQAAEHGEAVLVY